MVFCQALVLGSTLALFFIITDFVCELFGIGRKSIGAENKNVEEVVAAFANEESSEFVKT